MCGTCALKKASCRSCISSQLITSVCRSRPRPIDELLDVVDGFLRVPARIDVEDQRAQPVLLAREIRDIRAVDAAAHTDDAVVDLPLPSALMRSMTGASSRSPRSSGCQFGRMFS